MLMLRPILLALAALCIATAPALAQAAAERLFYYVDSEDSYESLVAHIDQISVVAPSVYRVDSLGIIWGGIDRRVLELAKQHDVRVMPLVVNESFHQPSLHKLLSDSTAGAAAIERMVALCRANGFWGLQIDFENLSVQDRDRFTAWYTAAARAMHAAGFTISAAVVHRPGELPGTTGYHRFLFDSWRGGYDLAAIGKAADFISIMSYNQHTRRTPPGPQAGLPWMRDVADYFLRYVPPEKLSLGIATQGMHWYTREDTSIPERARSWAETVSWTWGSGLAERHGAPLHWDDTQKVTWGYFANGGTFEWLFLEDVRSFEARLALAREKGMRGISVWVLGPEDVRIWDLLREQRAARD